MKYLVIVAALALAIIIGVGSAGFWVYSSMTTPVEHARAGQYIAIAKGSSPSQIVSQLTDEGILPNRYAPLIFLRLFGNPAGLQAGEYNFESPIAPIRVLKELEKGEERTIKLTIPEGFNRFDIAKRIVEKFPQTPLITEQEILAMMDDTSAIKDLDPNAKNLEGYMYPSTYNFPRETKPREIISAMIAQFRKVWQPDWTEKARSLGRTPAEVVTLASLIETEAGIAAERPIVASVIYNRLAKNIPLGIDMTVIYVAKMQNRWDGTVNRSDLDTESPYNTRKYGGIPPGPISSVSESSLKAALEPAQTDYLYYVRNVELNDGSHKFYASAADFEKGKAEYQQWLEAERQAKRANQPANQ